MNKSKSPAARTFSAILVCLVTPLLFFSAAPSSHAQAEQGRQEQKVLGETETKWPGVKLQITKLLRIDATHILAAVNVMVTPTGPNLVYIGDPPPAGYPPPNAPPQVADQEKYQPIPFSLAIAKLIDETTEQEFDAVADVPNSPYFGPNALITTLNRNCGVQMGVLFPVPPPPPPGPDGKYPSQKATIILPKASHPIKHLILPRPE